MSNNWTPICCTLNDSKTEKSPPARTGYGSSASKIPGPKAVPPGYMNCAHCGRNFAEETAERHIPWCAEQQKRKAVKQGNPGKILSLIKY